MKNTQVKYCDICKASKTHKQNVVNGTLLWECLDCLEAEIQDMIRRIRGDCL